MILEPGDVLRVYGSRMCTMRGSPKSHSPMTMAISRKPTLDARPNKMKSLILFTIVGCAILTCARGQEIDAGTAMRPDEPEYSVLEGQREWAESLRQDAHVDAPRGYANAHWEQVPRYEVQVPSYSETHPH